MPTIRIERMTYGADGIGHLENGKTVFVPETCPGDLVEVEIVKDQPRFARGKVTAVIEPSPERVTPPCPYVGQCGGCSWQHIAYDTQLVWKRKSIVDALTRIGKIDGDRVEELVSTCVPSSKQWGYRNKIELEVNRKSKQLELGFHRAGSDDITPIASCLLLPKKFSKVPKALSGALRFASGNEDLGIERVGLRVSMRTGDLEVALWTKTGSFARGPVSKILRGALPTTSITRVLLKGTQKERKVTGVECLSGKGFWQERIGEETLAFSSPSFFQVNTSGAEKLIELVMDGLSPNSEDWALDLYSGAGTFTIPLAKACEEVSAVESYGSSVRDLRRNLEMCKTAADVIGGDVARELPELEEVDIVIVDPPRAGLAPEVIDALVETDARKIAYVSCDPATLARDLALFEQTSYRVESITPVDLFPQTYHVESVCILSKEAN